jgi:hypothetical protein
MSILQDPRSFLKQRGYKTSWLIATLLLLMLVSSPSPATAQSTPFWFILPPPSYQDGRITYQFELHSLTDLPLSDVVIKIPIPAGTRYVESNAQPSLTVEFDGKELKYSSNYPIEPFGAIKVASFVVEVTDPARAVFETRAYIEWYQREPGNYLTDDIVIDITRESLNWIGPRPSRLNLEGTAQVNSETISFLFYLNNFHWRRMWDVQVNVPIPEGTRYLSAEAPPNSFTVDFDGQEVFFSITELPREVLVGPLVVNVTLEDTTIPLVKTHGWASWKNVGVGVGSKDVAVEEFRTGDIVVELHSSQLVISDMIGDVPFDNYDLTSLALEDNGSALKITFYTAGNIGAVGQRLEYVLYIDADCQAETGQRRQNVGLDYRLRYDHQLGRAAFLVWDEAIGRWDWSHPTVLNGRVSGNVISIWLPYELLGERKQFCWFAEAVNDTQRYNPSPPSDILPNRPAPQLTLYSLEGVRTQFAEGEDLPNPTTSSFDTFIGIGDVWQYLPGWSEPPENWPALGFDDSNWFSGPTSIGEGTSRYATDLSLVVDDRGQDQLSLVQQVDPRSGMVVAVLPSGDQNQSLFMRRSFEVTAPNNIGKLRLLIDYRGGFIAYLNGVEVARQNLGAPGTSVSHTDLAVDPEAAVIKFYDLSKYVSLLKDGTNVLAIEVNRLSPESDLYVAPTLNWQLKPVIITEVEPDGAETALPAVPLVPPSITDISGKLAVSIDNGRAFYDVYVFNMPDGQELDRISNARQPNLRFDGQRMLINREGDGVENVYEYNFIDGSQSQVSDAPQDWHPFYDPWGNRVVYGNTELTNGRPVPKLDEKGEVLRNERTGEIINTGARKPFIFVQCGLLPPHNEVEPRCRDIPSLGVLVPAAQFGEIQGTHPVWTTTDMIVYKGCNTWSGSQLCGIYSVPSSSTKGFSNGFIPRQLTRASDIPTDTKGNWIAFMSGRDGNWEAYVMDLDGNGVRNLSNSSGSNDGLPTISPDGNWVAFVSDRGGAWEIWVAPIWGGTPQKLFELPVEVPWGSGDRRDWTNERISWGP